MSQEVILNRLEADPRALVKNTIFTLGNKYVEPGDSYDPMKRRRDNEGRVAPSTWREKFLVIGASSSKPFIAEPASLRKSVEYHRFGYLIDVFESVAQRSIVARTLEERLGILTIGQLWEPIGEDLELVVSESGFHFGSDADAEVCSTPLEERLKVMDSMLSAAVGVNSRAAGLVMQSTLNMTNNLLGL